jgi:probable rRNA maturation factor
LTPPDLSDVPAELRRPVAAALEAAGIEDGHLGIEIVGEGRMRTLNYAHRGLDEATDVLAFPLDLPETGRSSASPSERPRIDRPAGPRELGDVFVCPAMATDVKEAAVHGTLHLCGYDHEEDDGEMLALQDEIMSGLE